MLRCTYFANLGSIPKLPVSPPSCTEIKKECKSAPPPHSFIALIGATLLFSVIRFLNPWLGTFFFPPNSWIKVVIKTKLIDAKVDNKFPALVAAF